MNTTPGLYAPDSYLRALPEVVEKVVNGCGPGGWKYDIIPDTILGLRVTEACNIHDWMYNEGTTHIDKEFADTKLHSNLIILIDKAPGFFNWLLRYHRKIRAWEYYEAVKVGGNTAFWANKTKIQREQDKLNEKEND